MLSARTSVVCLRGGTGKQDSDRRVARDVVAITICVVHEGYSTAHLENAE